MVLRTYALADEELPPDSAQRPSAHIFAVAAKSLLVDDEFGDYRTNRDYKANQYNGMIILLNQGIYYHSIILVGYYVGYTTQYIED